ncbi:MAG: tetratricopeptide repeat protein [Dorea sp.]
MKQRKNILLILALSLMLTACGANPYDQGVEQLENGQYEEAEASFGVAIEQEKNVADSYRGLGIACWELGDYEGAKEALLQAVENGSEKTITLYALLGNCELELQNAESALEYYEKVLEAEEIEAGLLQDVEYNMIVAYEQLMDMDTAKEKLAEYMEKYPDDEDAAKEAEFLETR